MAILISLFSLGGKHILQCIESLTSLQGARITRIRVQLWWRRGGSVSGATWQDSLQLLLNGQLWLWSRHEVNSFPTFLFFFLGDLGSTDRISLRYHAPTPLAQGEISPCVCFTTRVWKKPNTCVCGFSHTCLVFSTLMCNKTHLCG